MPATPSSASAAIVAPPSAPAVASRPSFASAARPPFPMMSFHAIKVRLVLFSGLWILAPALNGHAAGGLFLCRLSCSSAHFGALLLKNRFARQANAVALDGEYLYQHLVAFLQLIANVLNAVLRYLADVQQAVGTGNDFHKGPEISQP